MKNLLLLGLLIILIKCNIIAQCTLDKTNWTLVFNEEFNTDITDLKTRWNIFTGPSLWDTDKYYRSIEKEENITISGGMGYFETKVLDSVIMVGPLEYRYSTAKMISKFDDIPYCNSNSNAGYLYGMFEIRCKLPKTWGLYPAYWLYGDKAWPPEIDVFEFNGTFHDYFFSSTIWGAPSAPGRCTNYYHYPFDLTDSFHTWTVVWTPTQVSFFFDNKELKTESVPSHVPGTDSPSMWERCLWRKMNHQVGSALNYPDTSTYYFEPLIVDYIKVYKPTGYQTYDTSALYSFDYWHDSIVKPLYLGAQYKSTQDWILQKIISPSDNYNSLSDLNALQGGGKYYYKGDFDLLWTTYWYDYGSGPQYYSAPLSWNEGDVISGNVSVASITDIPFFRQINRLGYYQDSVFSTIPNVNNVKSTIITNPNGLQVVYLGTDNNLWECQRPSLAGAWLVTKITTTGDVTSEIIFDNSNYNKIYFINSAKRIVKLTKLITWGANTIMNHAEAFSSLSINPGGNYICYRTSSKVLRAIGPSPGPFGGWGQPFDINAVSPYSNNLLVPVNNVSKNICVGGTPNPIYYIGDDNRVWWVYSDGTNHSTPIDWKVNYAARDLRFSNPPISDQTLYFVGTDNQIRRFYWDTCAVLNPTCEDSIFLKPPPSLVSNILLENQDPKVALFPNPASDQIEILLPEVYSGSTSIVILNTNGQELKRTISNTRNIILSIVDLPSGLYFIKTENRNHFSVNKFYKI